MTRSRPPAGSVPVGALASIVALLAACSNSGVKSQGPPSSGAAAISSSASPGSSSSGPGSPSISSGTSEAVVRATVGDAWLNYWRVYNDMPTKYPQAGWPSLAAGISVDPIKSQVLRALNAEKQIGVVPFGAPVHHIYWPSNVGTAKTATIGDCMDTSTYGSKFESTGQRRSVGVAKNNTQASLILGADGKWRVSQIAYITDKPC